MGAGKFFVFPWEGFFFNRGFSSPGEIFSSASRFDLASRLSSGGLFFPRRHWSGNDGCCSEGRCGRLWRSVGLRWSSGSWGELLLWVYCRSGLALEAPGLSVHAGCSMICVWLRGVSDGVRVSRLRRASAATGRNRSLEGRASKGDLQCSPPKVAGWPGWCCFVACCLQVNVCLLCGLCPRRSAGRAR